MLHCRWDFPMQLDSRVGQSVLIETRNFPTYDLCCNLTRNTQEVNPVKLSIVNYMLRNFIERRRI